MKRRVAIVTHYCGNYGGGVTSVVNDIKTYASDHCDIQIFGLDHPGVVLNLPRSFKWGRLGLDNNLSLKLLSWQPDLIHLHGMFTFVSCSALRAASAAKIPLVVSPHGMLEPWALNNSKFKKILFLSFIERKVLTAAARIHALNLAEMSSILGVADFRSKVCVIPNGVSRSRHVGNHFIGKPFTLLYLGRIHPKKGVAELLRGLFLLKMIRGDLLKILQVNIVGWGDHRFMDEMNTLARSLNLTDTVYFRGPAYDVDKARYFASADAFILPSFSEGLPMAVLEAWSYGLPVMMTPECNLPEGFESRAAIQIQTNPEDLANSIAAMLAMPRDELRAIGQRGLDLVCNKFSWDSVAKQYLDMYDEVLSEHEAKKLSKS